MTDGSKTLLSSDALQLQHCILLSSSGNNAQASLVLDHLRSDPQQWIKLCLEILQGITCTNNATAMNGDRVHVVFYVLNSFQKYLRSGWTTKNSSSPCCLSTDTDVRLKIRTAVWSYLQHLHQQLVSSSGANTSGVMPPSFIRTKIAVVLAQCLQYDFPHHWPTAFSDFLSLISSDGDGTNSMACWLLEDVFVRTCEAISEEIVVYRADRTKEEVQRNNEVKDRMKGSGGGVILKQSTQAMLGIVETRRRHGGTSDELCVLALSTLKRYLGWMDWTIVAGIDYEAVASLSNFHVLNIIFSCIGGGGEVAVAACDCFLEIVDREEADVSNKVMLFVRVNLYSVLGNIDLDDNIDLAIKAAEMLAASGIELLQCLEALPVEKQMREYILHVTKHQNGSKQSDITVLVIELLQQMMPVFWKCFIYDDIDVTTAVLPFASQLTVTLGKQIKMNYNVQQQAQRHALSFPVIDHFPQLMSIMYQQMQYPDDFGYDYTDEDDAEEEVLRSKLRKLNEKIIKILPIESLQFLCGALANVTMPLSAARTSEVEAALRLVFHYCEGLSAAATSLALEEGPFRQVVEALHQSDVACHPHREVIIRYYDIVVRYAKVLKGKQDLLPGILSVMSGAQGLQHSHPRVRSRSCYLLLRLVREMGPILRPYVETAVGGIQGLLTNQASLPLQSDDSLYLFETTGLLIGKSGLDESEQQRYLLAVLAPHIRSIEEIISSGNLPQDPDHYGGILANYIAATAYMIKPISKPSPELKKILIGIVPVLLLALQSLPANEHVRGKTMIALQRMIICLNVDIIPHMSVFLELLISHCDSKDILDVTQLLNQLCIKFKSAAVPSIDSSLMPFLRKCYELMPQASEVGELAPHLVTEQLSIRKLIFIFLHHVVTRKATAVLLSPTNGPKLEEILQVMKEGAVSIKEPSIKKTCLTFFRGLVDQWAGDRAVENIQIQTGFIRFIFENLLPEMLRCILSPEFNERDAMQSRNVSEIAKLLGLLKSKLEQGFAKFVTTQLRSLGFQNEIIVSFEQASSDKDFETCLKSTMAVLKRRSK